MKNTDRNRAVEITDAGIIPTVMRPSANGDRPQDIVSALLNDGRIIFVTNVVTIEMSEIIVADLLHLENVDSKKPIWMYIDSPGGSVTAGLGIYNIMRTRKCPVYTLVYGQASSMGAFLLSAGQKGNRYAMEFSRIMIHQPSGGAEGKASDIEIQAEEIKYHKALLNKLLAKHTGQPIERVEKDTDRDFFMSAKDCVEYGLVDKVIDVP
ncbi:ATP-dependent Clp endopeptidase proteolytic subunit ClpP [soil metagenome]